MRKFPRLTLSSFGHTRFSDMNGFTLIEILLAFFIFAIVMSTIYGSYSGTFYVINVTESQSEMYRKARIAMERITDDLQSSFYSQQYGRKEEFIGLEKEIDNFRADSLRFTSTAHLVFSDQETDSGTAVIAYEVVESEDNDGLSLLRHDRPEFLKDLDYEDGGLVLCDKLREVRFVYYDSEGEEFNSWDSTSFEFEDMNPRESIPRRVKIILKFIDDSVSDTAHSFTTSVILPISQEI